MTRTAIGGIAAGAFTLGIFAGLVVPGSLAASRNDQVMANHMSAIWSMPMTNIGSMPMMGTGSMPMMGMGYLRMGGDSAQAGHAMHHAPREVGR
jgi:hypothetical protein